MRALICQTFGQPEDLVVGSLRRRSPIAGEVEIKVHSAGIAFADTLMIRNLHQNKHKLPFSPGVDIAGLISAIGEGVTNLSVGQRVMGFVYDGAYAQYAVTRIEDVFALPDEIGFDTAAAMGSVYCTVHTALRWEARIERHETLLVLGAAGGIGMAAIDVGRALGVTVIAAASTADKLAAAQLRGANYLVNYIEESLRDVVMRITNGKGVDVVIDPVSGPFHEAALGSLGWGGRYLIVGFAGGAVPKIAANRLLVKNRAALGHSLYHYRRHQNARLRESVSDLQALTASGTLTPEVSQRVELGQAPAVMRRLIDREMRGKAVIVLRPEATA